VRRRDVSAALERVGLRVDEIEIVRRIPRDPRHRSKIDYEKLSARR
jgi:hypothetical protein